MRRAWVQALGAAVLSVLAPFFIALPAATLPPLRPRAPTPHRGRALVPLSLSLSLSLSVLPAGCSVQRTITNSAKPVSWSASPARRTREGRL
jgi:hypothetical protein